MKRCPTCQRTYDDNMKFCQTDGTLLVAQETQQTSTNSSDYDPYKTVLGNSFENETANQPSINEADYDPMKTMLGTPPVDLPPPSPFGAPTSNPPQVANLDSPSFGDLSSSSSHSSETFDQPLRANDSSNQFGQQSSGQFGESGRTPMYKEPEPFGQNFGQQPSFGQTANEWTPPPAPQQNWGNQGLGQNTPFGAPLAASVQGRNQTLPIVSLVCGIFSVLCCWLAPIIGLAALITGYMGMNNANKNPESYGGKGLAIGGLITGGIGLLIGVGYYVLVILGSVAGNF